MKQSSTAPVKWMMTLMPLLLLAGCAQPLRKFPDRALIPDSTVVPWNLSEKPADELTLLYQGCGNLLLTHNGEGIITDPFFSNQSPLRLAGRIKSSKKQYEHWKSTIAPTRIAPTIQTALVAHTHYDHAMDLPLVLAQREFPNLDTVWGNAYLPRVLTHFANLGVSIDSLRKEEVYDGAGDLQYKWLAPSTNVRVLPIATQHAPHTKKRLLMNGKFREAHFTKRLRSADDKVCAFKWTTGQSFAFLIDWLKDDRVVFRLYVQTSASGPPDGLPPPEVIQARPADLAILCLASMHNVADYPRFLIQATQAKKLMLIHWEDFFRKRWKQPKMIRLTKLKRVSERLHEIPNLHLPEDVMIPRPGTTVRVRF